MLKNFLSSKTITVDDILAMDASQYIDFFSTNTESMSAISEAIAFSQASAEWLCAVLNYCKQADYRERAQLKLENEAIDANLLLEVVITSQFVDSRKWAAEQLNDETIIKQAYKQVQSKDKNTARILHIKLEQLKTEAKTREQQQSQLSKLLQQISELSTAAYSPQYRGRYLLLVQQWNEFDFAIDESSQQQFKAYCELIDKALLDYQQIDEANQLQEALLEQLQSLWK